MSQGEKAKSIEEKKKVKGWSSEEMKNKPRDDREEDTEEIIEWRSVNQKKMYQCWEELAERLEEDNIQELAQKLRNFRMAADDWKKKSGACKLEKKGEASVRHSPMGASTLLWSSSSLWEWLMQGSKSKPCKRSSTEGSKFQPLSAYGRKRRRRRRSKYKRQPVAKWVHQRRVGAMKAFWMVLLMVPVFSRQISYPS